MNLKANAHYLPGAMIRLPVRDAAAVLEVAPRAGGRSDLPAPTRLVQRRRVAAALDAKRREATELLEAPELQSELRERLLDALTVCRDAAERLRGSAHRLRPGAYHYLEVLAEMMGGPQASIPEDPGI